MGGDVDIEVPSTDEDDDDRSNRDDDSDEDEDNESDIQIVSGPSSSQRTVPSSALGSSQSTSRSSKKRTYEEFVEGSSKDR
jgi:hypothetical protein